MLDLFSDDVRRDPFPLYDRFRADHPLIHEPQTGLWMVFDYDGAKRVLTDHEAFSSRAGPADWLVFTDPPRHLKLRALISQAFTPRSVVNLEPRIRELSGGLLDHHSGRGPFDAASDREMDLAADYAVQLPILVIADMLGIPPADRHRFKRWNDAILNMSYTIPGGKGSPEAMSEFAAVTNEMDHYLAELVMDRGGKGADDLLSRLRRAEIDGERLTHQEILGFFQGLLLAGSETTTNLITSAILCFIENPDQLALLRQRMDLLPSAVEETLRCRSPVQWMFRVTKLDVSLHGQVIPRRSMVLAMIGSANRDPRYFANPHRFDVTRDPNPHIAFGHGAHFCLGAPLARLEARIALSDLLARMRSFKLAGDGWWEPRRGLHVYGPTSLPIRFTPAASA